MDTVDLGENPPVRSDGHVEEQPSLGSAAAGPWPDEVRKVGEVASGKWAKWLQGH